MGRKIAQLAGFIDQAGLFRTLRAVTYKLHFLHSLGGFLEDFRDLECFWNSAGGNSTADARACRIAHPHPAEAPTRPSRRMVYGAHGSPGEAWRRPETAQAPPHPKAMNLKAAPS